jgi:hypothetical protein
MKAVFTYTFEELKEIIANHMEDTIIDISAPEIDLFDIDEDGTLTVTK